MNLSLQKVEHSARLSRETAAFFAVVCEDGKPLFEVWNDGHGGCDFHGPALRQNRAQFEANLQRVRDYAASLPPVQLDAEHSIECDLDILISRLLDRHLEGKRLARLLKKSALYVRDGKIWSLAQKGVPVVSLVAVLKKRDPAIVILNELPFDQAVERFIEGSR